MRSDRFCGKGEDSVGRKADGNDIADRRGAAGRVELFHLEGKAVELDITLPDFAQIGDALYLRFETG